MRNGVMRRAVERDLFEPLRGRLLSKVRYLELWGLRNEGRSVVATFGEGNGTGYLEAVFSRESRAVLEEMLGSVFEIEVDRRGSVGVRPV